MKIPHKILISLRLKTHELTKFGEFKPPAVHDTGDIIETIEADSFEDAMKKKDELLKRIKEWLKENF